MRASPLHISSVIFFVLLAGTSSTAALRVYAKVDAETAIYPGQVFKYSVIVEGGTKPSKIDISPLAPFNPQPAGEGTAYQQFNDQVVISYSANYGIVATKAGTMRLPAVTVVVDGKTYATNAVEVTVSQPGTTDRMSLEFTLSEKQCYVGQPLVMTVKWIVTARVQNAGFDVPVFKSNDFYIEDVSQATGSWAKEQANIHGVPVMVTEDRQLVRGMEAAVISFSKVLIPKRSGAIKLEPVSVSVDMAVGRVRTSDFFNPYSMKFERVLVQSKPIELNVSPLPKADKPPEFYGLVGRYTISASATPTTVNVGDPITLVIRIGGNPYLKPVQWPVLEQIPDLAAHFRIPAEKASPTIEGGNKVFTQTIRASSDVVVEVPAIPLAYFDPQEGKYVVARTEPIKLEVAPTKVLTNVDVEGTASAPANREVEAIRKGLSANYYGPEVLVDQHFSLLSAAVSPGYAALWSIPLMGLIVSAVVKIAGRTSPDLVARKRRRQACGTATSRLRPVSSADPKERHELLLTAMKGYIGDRFDKVAASLTADDCYRAVIEATGSAEAATKYRELIAACEAARYTPLEAQVGSEEVQHAVDLIQSVERQSPR